MPRTATNETYTRVCPICGRTFYNYMGNEWVYYVNIKYRRVDVCRYNCMLAHERGEKYGNS